MRIFEYSVSVAFWHSAALFGFWLNNTHTHTLRLGFIVHIEASQNTLSSSASRRGTFRTRLYPICLLFKVNMVTWWWHDDDDMMMTWWWHGDWCKPHIAKWCQVTGFLQLRGLLLSDQNFGGCLGRLCSQADLLVIPKRATECKKWQYYIIYYNVQQNTANWIVQNISLFRKVDIFPFSPLSWRWRLAFPSALPET